MFRKLILSTLIATAALGGIGLTATPADASQLTAFLHGRRYDVLVRCGNHWENRGSYRTRYEAEHAVTHLRFQGFDAVVHVC